MRTQKWLAVFLLLLLAGPTRLAIAQSDSGRISGTVRDQTGAWVAEAAVTLKNERTGETRAATTNRDGFFAVAALKPSMYTVTVTKEGFAPIQYTELPIGVGQELALDFEFKLAGGSGIDHRCRSRAGGRPQLGEDRRERQRARSAEPADQRPPDVAADAAGARFPERRHRDVAGHSLLGPSGRAERHQVRRRRGLRRSSMRRRAT